VLADPALQERLRAETDWPAFAALVQRLAGERGLSLTAEELEGARRAARRAFIERRL
jgi:hypothetical protein